MHIEMVSEEAMENAMPAMDAHSFFHVFEAEWSLVWVTVASQDNNTEAVLSF